MSKKIILFIVEGYSEKVALEMALDDLFDDRNDVYFKIVKGDITSDLKKYTSLNIEEGINKQIYIFLNKTRLFKEDISMVVQIVDTDGVFINSRNVKSHDKERTLYNENNIFTKFVDKIILRNIVKAGILNKLKDLLTINYEGENIKYSIYYMSSNLDHVIHNDANLLNGDKKIKALDFQDYYKEELGLKKFIIFFKERMIMENDTYESSWNRLENNNNSLMRASNFYLFLKQFK